MLESKRLFVSACEPSANIHLQFLAKNLDSSVQVCGIFEPNVFAHFPNAKASYTLENFAVMGFFDVIKKINFFKEAINKMIKLAEESDVVLLMDSSSFNLPIAKALKKNGSKVPIVYYILPQVWAWKPWRAKQIESICDYLCAILPFELAMYPRAQKEKRIQYVGHPLLDEIPALKEQPLPLENGKIAFMPGSRKSEIQRIFPVFVKVAKQLPNKKVLIIPEHFKNLESYELAQIYGNDIEMFEISYDANTALYESSFAFICSGTATLQATLIGTPLVLGYKTRNTDILFARIFVRLNHIGLANILYNALHLGNSHIGTKQIHPELIQSNLTAINLLKAYNDTRPELFFSQVKELRDYLQHGSAEKLATLLTKLLHKN